MEQSKSRTAARWALKILGAAAIVAVAKFAGLWAGRSSAMDHVVQQASEQHMPTGFNGVRWLETVERVRELRPTVTEMTRGGLAGMLAEPLDYMGRRATFGYYPQGGNIVMYVVYFEGDTTREAFARIDEGLNRDFGPMQAARPERDEYGDKFCSHRQSERFAIDHCIHPAAAESIVFSRVAAAK